MKSFFWYAKFVSRSFSLDDMSLSSELTGNKNTPTARRLFRWFCERSFKIFPHFLKTKFMSSQGPYEFFVWGAWTVFIFKCCGHRSTALRIILFSTFKKGKKMPVVFLPLFAQWASSTSLCISLVSGTSFFSLRLSCKSSWPNQWYYTRTCRSFIVH